MCVKVLAPAASPAKPAECDSSSEIAPARGTAMGVACAQRVPRVCRPLHLLWATSVGNGRSTRYQWTVSHSDCFSVPSAPAVTCGVSSGRGVPHWNGEQSKMSGVGQTLDRCGSLIGTEKGVEAAKLGL